LFWFMGDLDVGIIPDGHRRFSELNDLGLRDVYKVGLRKLFEVGTFLFRGGEVKELVVYFLSTENLKRGKRELKILFDLLRSSFRFVEDGFCYDDLSDEEKVVFSESDVGLWKDRIRVCFVGKRELFDKDVNKFLSCIEDRTKGNSDFVVNIAIGYGGKQELVDCFNRVSSGLSSGVLSGVDESVIRDNLEFSKDIDLVVRSGFNRRLSNFFCWQSSYADLFFLDKLWPDVTLGDFKKVLSDFSLIDRRKGT